MRSVDLDLDLGPSLDRMHLRVHATDADAAADLATAIRAQVAQLAGDVRPPRTSDDASGNTLLVSIA